MEEKVIIKSENYKVKKAFVITLCISLVIYFISFLPFPSLFVYHLNDYNSHIEHWENRIEEYNGFGSDIEDLEEGLKSVKDKGPALLYAIRESAFEWIGDYINPFIRLLICFGGPQLIAGIIYLWLKSYELTITDKRAYGHAAFGRRVDLPVDSITAIGFGWLKSIKITTASGKISFLLIKNRDEMYDTISKLIVERQQGKQSEQSVTNITNTDEADKLKKFKELLDSGVITEEEFEQKKKQLLGL